VVGIVKAREKWKRQSAFDRKSGHWGKGKDGRARKHEHKAVEGSVLRECEPDADVLQALSTAQSDTKRKGKNRATTENEAGKEVGLSIYTNGIP